MLLGTTGEKIRLLSRFWECKGRMWWAELLRKGWLAGSLNYTLVCLCGPNCQNCLSIVLWSLPVLLGCFLRASVGHTSIQGSRVRVFSGIESMVGPCWMIHRAGSKAAWSSCFSEPLMQSQDLSVQQ